MDVNQRGEYLAKLAKVRAYLDSNGDSAAILGRRENFSWITSGGNNTVVSSSELGFGFLVIKMEQVYLVAHRMDAQRIYDDELLGTEIELVSLAWHEATKEATAIALAGKGSLVSDFPLLGAREDQEAITSLHYPLSDREIELAKSLASDSERIIRKVADQLDPGMSEREAANMLAGDYSRAGIAIEVLLVGGIERLSRYRHPVPSAQPLGSTVLLHPAVVRGGIHANITRMVQLGAPLSAELEDKYRLLCQLQATTLQMCLPGREFSEIFRRRRELLEEGGYPDEWENHFPGGPTGYVLARGDWGAKAGLRVSDGQLFDWFITVTGAKVEELTVTHQGRREILSQAGHWPTKPFTAEGLTLDVPWILER